MRGKLSAVMNVIFFLVFGAVTAIYAADVKPIQLPQPQTDQGKPLMQALKERKSSREFSAEKLPAQVLSNLLWAAWGINRPDSGKRTAPSARNRQEIDIYVATADGLYLYDPKANRLLPILSGDIRAATGRQSYVSDAPVNLVYVADLAKISEETDVDKTLIAAANTGFVSENVYLYCASEGLATVVRALIDRPKLAEIMKLRSEQKIILAQTVGYPKSKKGK